MIVGVPREIKPGENRVAITPTGVHELAEAGHRILVETGAGEGSTIHDDEYRGAGAVIVPDADTIWGEADLVCKVKEPLASEIACLRPGVILFTYLHVAAYPAVGEALLERSVTGVGYETVQLPDGRLPLLAPMSEVAGRLAPQIGAHFLERASGGRGLLLGGVTGVRPGNVVVLGAGMAGMSACQIAAGMEANVVVVDVDADRLRLLDLQHRGRVVTMASSKAAVHEYVTGADLVIGAVLRAGERAPVVVREDTVRAMRRGSVVIDVSIDQGGCIATSRETTHDDPVFVLHDVVHYGVGNIPAAVPHTSTYALTNATLPYLEALAAGDLAGAVARRPALGPGVQFAGGEVTNAAVADTLGRQVVTLTDAFRGG